MNTNNLLIILTFIAVVLSVYFYWYEIRDNQVRTECDKFAEEAAKSENYFDDRYNLEDYNHYYLRCLRNK